MYIIRAIPGSCGDIVSSVIDNNDSFLTPTGAISFVRQRCFLKRNRVDIEKLPTLLKEASLTYNSISCQHYIEDIMTDNRYKTITINVNSDELFTWCIARLNVLFPKVIFEKEKLKQEMEFHNRSPNFRINLSDILTGKLIEKLNQYEIPVMSSELYYKWLSINTKKFPYNLV